MQITVDGKVISTKEGQSVLDAALDAGIFIPNLCHHPDLMPYGACRLCLVEIEGEDGPQESCSTIVREGMVVKTTSEHIDRLRRLSLELMLAEHPNDCSGCPKFGSCPLQSMLQYLGVTGGRMRSTGQIMRKETGNPLFVRDMARCIKCGRCVRACRALRKANALDYHRDKNGDVVVENDLTLTETDMCRYCTACVAVCPTGALQDKPETFRLPEGTAPADELVPCRATCPAHTDVPRYLRYVKEGRYDDALAVIREAVPFPKLLGYVCMHPCETACRREFVSEPVSIRNIKRFAATYGSDAWKARRKQLPPTGKRVAVVGGGPAGLTSAYYLAKQGHSVTVFEALPEAGGMTRYGIPEYRVPRDVVRKEIADIQEVGVEIKTGERVTSAAELKAAGYDAVVLAIGTHAASALPLDGSGNEGVYRSVDFLRAARLDEPMPVGKRVLVAGGGDVAFDCARLALRLGAEEVHVACLEARDVMTARPEEIAEALEEGVLIHPGRSFVRIEGDGHVTGMTLEKVKSFSFDANGAAVIEKEPDSLETIAVDNVIFAVGQKPAGADAFGVALKRGAYFEVDGDQRCSEPGVFAAGDAVTGTRNVIEAVAGGKKAASAVDLFLGGDGDISEKLAPDEPLPKEIGEYQGFCSLMRLRPEAQEPGGRVHNMQPVESCFAEDAARFEAGRCLQCDLRTQICKQRLWSSFAGEGREEA